MSDPVLHDVVRPELCARLHGRSVRDCLCRLPDKRGWLECPPEARRIIRNARPVPGPLISGDCCQECGAFALVRTGTCQTCLACGSSSGGCS